MPIVRPNPIRHPRGVTLLELIVVMAILCLIMAIGIGAFIKMSAAYKEQGSLADIDVLIRQTRNAALSASTMAFVEIDQENRRVVPWACRVEGLWHFEEKDQYGKTTGARHAAKLQGAKLIDDGKIGRCVRLVEDSCIDCGDHPDFDLENGGTVEAYVWLSPGTMGFIFNKENSYSLSVDRSGTLTGKIGREKVTGSYKIAPNRWTKVALAWDRQNTRILVDDCIVGFGPGAKAPITDNALFIGFDGGGIVGKVDEARVISADPGTPVPLLLGSKLTHTAAPWSAIYFAADGSLDVRYHTGPLSLTLVTGTKRRELRLTLLGETQRMEVEDERDTEQ